VKRDPDNVLTELSADPNDNTLREFHWIHGSICSQIHWGWVTWTRDAGLYTTLGTSSL
jgi:hypothetical protein